MLFTSLSASIVSISRILSDIMECSGVISPGELSSLLSKPFVMMAFYTERRTNQRICNSKISQNKRLKFLLSLVLLCSLSSLWRKMVSCGTDAKYGVGSKSLNGKFTTFWDFTHLLLTKLKRFRCTIRIGGNFQIWSFFVAGCLPLQWLHVYHSSSFSSLVNDRRQWSRSTGSVCCLRQIDTDSCSVQI